MKEEESNVLFGENDVLAEIFAINEDELIEPEKETSLDKETDVEMTLNEKRIYTYIIRLIEQIDEIGKKIAEVKAPNEKLESLIVEEEKLVRRRNKLNEFLYFLIQDRLKKFNVYVDVP